MFQRSWPLLLLIAGWKCAMSANSAGSVPFETVLHARVSMRDGIRLDTNIFRPTGLGRVPTILLRTPYGKGSALLPGYVAFIQHGFAVVMQDVRGRPDSEGVFDALGQEGPDGSDTVDWIARQPWSNGNVGMIGGSYLGIAQWKLAVLNNPHLKAIFPVVSGCDDYLDRFYSPGGASKLGHRLLWLSENLLEPGISRPRFSDYVHHLPLRTADRAATGHTVGLYQASLDHPTYDAFWHNLSVRDRLDRVRTPAFIVGGWYDNYVESDLEAFSTLERDAAKEHRRASNRILIGPWAHNMSLKFTNVDFGVDEFAPLRRYQLDWFDRWLKGMPDELPAPEGPDAWHDKPEFADTASVHIFVMGANRWRDEQEWPLARTRYTPLYLVGKGHANSSDGDGELDWKAERTDEPDRFVYDPGAPVPTLGGAVCCNPKIFPWGPIDQAPVEKRKDVLVYTTEPLKHELEVTGSIRAVLYVSTTAPDTDFTAKLVDVFPNGDARNLTDGVLRLRYRDGLDKVVMARPGEVYPIRIDVGATSNVFLPGHRIRVEISSSNFPRFDRNPNTGRLVADETVLKKAEQTVFHGRQYPSHIVLPIVPDLTAVAPARYFASVPTIAKAVVPQQPNGHKAR